MNLLGAFAIVCSSLVPPARALAQEPEPAFLLELRDGSIRFGDIVEHDPEGILFRRLDTGGLARLSWRFLDPGQEARLRREFGYVDESGDELLVEAQRLELVDGREVVGLVLSRSESGLLVKTAEAAILIPLERIGAAASTVFVPALQVYTRAELYQQELARTAPDDAAGQLALARHCERILDFAHALEHYEKALALDRSLDAPDTRFALERARERAARQAEIDWLAEVEQLSARQKFAQALALADGFAERFPQSSLLPEAKKRRERVERARDRALSEAVVRRWHSAATQLARRAATKSLDEVVAWVEDKLSDEILALVLQEARRIDPEAGPERVRELWLARQGGRWRLASYGYGTWLLGEERALAGLKDEPEPAARTGLGEKDKERAALEEKIKRYLQNQRQQSRQAAAPDEAEKRERTWRELSSAARSGWILAFYAETTGDMQVRERIYFQACRECGGSGVRELLSTGDARTRAAGETGATAGVNRVTCTACQGLGGVRRIQYR